MGSLLSKISDMEANGELPQFDPANINDVLRISSKYGLRYTIMNDAMEFIRNNPKISNDDAIMLAAQKWNII
jgi:hypothetical protein